MVLSTWHKLIIAYGLLGVALWPVPLLNVLHAESSAVVATFAFFTAGWTSLAPFARGGRVGYVLSRQLAALLVPWLALTLSIVWAPNCDYLLGCLFYVLFTVPSVVLAVAAAFALQAYSVRTGRMVLGLAGLGIVLTGVVYDLGFHPQFYTYNHVFGGLLGPIYDEELALRPGLFVFRGLTLLWALLLMWYGAVRRVRAGAAAGWWTHPVVGVALAGGIAAVYAFSVPLGLNVTASHLQARLGGHLATAHFDLYYDPASLSEDAAHEIAADHEYRYARLAERLRLDVPDRIRSYLYPDPATKAALTGARYTNVAPVWLPEPQMHILLGSYDAVFGHELAHVFSRVAGPWPLRAPLSVGLVEGFAVALEPPDGRPTPHEQVIAAATRRLGVRKLDALGLGRSLAARLSPWGFWTGRGAVSYTTLGSFVAYLIETYGPAAFLQVYGGASFEAVYGRTVEHLALDWEAYLSGLPVIARATSSYVEQRFAVPSIFEKACPHFVPAYRRSYEEGQVALLEGRTDAARTAFEASLHLQPTYDAALSAWSRLRLADGAPEAVIQRIDSLQRAVDASGETILIPLLAVQLGDAYALAGNAGAARRSYDVALSRLPLFAHNERALIELRTLMADRPEIARILVSARSPAEKARALAEVADLPGAAVDYQAYLHAQAGAYREADSLLAAAPSPSALGLPAFADTTLTLQRTAWRAQWAYMLGRYETAGAYARDAARAYRRWGALNEARLLDDLAERAAWAGLNGRRSVMSEIHRTPSPPLAYIPYQAAH